MGHAVEAYIGLFTSSHGSERAAELRGILSNPGVSLPAALSEFRVRLAKASGAANAPASPRPVEFSQELATLAGWRAICAPYSRRSR